jgi:UDP-GlcNAc:undecaprenyl-phosphate GlcNAc-1-phosphate transferase
MHFDLVLVFLTSLILGLSIFPVFIRLSYNNKITDKREARKIHLHEVPTLGGVPIFVSFLVSLFIWGTYADLLALRFLAGSLLFVFFIGLRDDFVSLKPLTKLLSQIVPAIAMFYLSDIKIDSFYGFISSSPFPEFVSLPLTVFTIIVITNSFNLIDGLDGLAGTISIIVLASFGVWFTAVGETSYSLILFAMAGSVYAFLQYNWYPAKIFMGDTGALLLGFFFSVVTIKFLNLNLELGEENIFKFQGGIATAIAVLFIPLFDTLRIFAIRFIKGKSPFKADKNHAHHVLFKLGLSHARVSIILGVINLFFVGLAVLFNSVGDNILVPAILFIGLVLSLLLDYLIKRKSSLEIIEII